MVKISSAGSSDGSDGSDGSGDTTSTVADAATAPPEVTGSGPFMISSGNDPTIAMPRSPGSTAQLDQVDAAGSRTRPRR